MAPDKILRLVSCQISCFFKHGTEHASADENGIQVIRTI